MTLSRRNTVPESITIIGHLKADLGFHLHPNSTPEPKADKHHHTQGLDDACKTKAHLRTSDSGSAAQPLARAAAVERP